MALSLVTDVTSEPVSLDELKAHLRLDVDDDDAYLAGCVAAARTWVEGQTRRAIMPQTWDYIIDYGWPRSRGGYRIDLPMNPVTSVTSITYVDSSGAGQTLATSKYTVSARTNGSFIVPAYDQEWPDVRCVPSAVTVRFVAGDADEIPQELHRAIMVLAGHYYEFRETGIDAPKAVEALISPLRSVSFA